MTALRPLFILIMTVLTGLAVARAENAPVQEPQIGIDPGMHTALIRRIDVSADGRLMVTGSDDKTARLWSLPDGKLLRVFRVPIGPAFAGRIFAVAISPDGRLVAAAGWDAYFGQNDARVDMYIYLFDTVTGTMVKRLGPIGNVVYELAFSKDGTRLAAGTGRGNGVQLWSAPFDGPPIIDRDFTGDVYGLDFDRSGRLAAASFDGSLRIYDAEFKLIKKTNPSGGSRPFAVAFSPDGNTLAVNYDDTIRIDLFNAADLSFQHQVDTTFANNGAFYGLSWSADGKSLYSGGMYLDPYNITPIFRWPDAGRGKPVLLGGPRATVLSLATLPRGGVAFGAGDPAFGMYGQDDKLVLYQGQVTADLRDKHSGRYWSAPDASGVWFGLKQGADDPWNFDISQLAFNAAPERPANYVEPQTQTLNIQNWANYLHPTLKGVLLRLDLYERSRSLAIAPDAKSFVLGAEWSIYRFDDKGEQIWRVSIPGIAWGVNLSADSSVIVAALGDGTIRWYRASDGAELLAFFVLVPDKRWIAWTPSGYYAASAGGEDLIGWHVNGKTWDTANDFFPVSRFRDRFYRPDIVQLVVRMKDERRAINEANIIAKRKSEEESMDKILPPVIEFITSEREIRTDKPVLTLTYRLRSPSGRAVTKIETKIDGRPVETRGVEVIDDTLSLDTDHELTLPVPRRDSEVSLIAYIDDQPSVAATITVKWTGKTSTGPKPNLYALLVGVSNYDDASLKLGYAAKDASDLAAALKLQEGREYGKVDIVELVDKQANKVAVETELAKLRRKAGPEDIAVVFMAGHGMTDAALDFYYLPVNANRDPDLLDATAINGIIIRNALAKIPGKVVLFMDACRSGRSIEGGSGSVDMTKLANDFAQDTSGLVMFASSTGREDSLESSAWNNGAFTSALLSTLADPSAYGRDGKLSVPELEEELTARVATLTEGRQNAVMTKYGAIPRFFLAALE